jgi:hypothetical protein
LVRLTLSFAASHSKSDIGSTIAICISYHTNVWPWKAVSRAWTGRGVAVYGARVSHKAAFERSEHRFAPGKHLG